MGCVATTANNPAGALRDTILQVVLNPTEEKNNALRPWGEKVSGGGDLAKKKREEGES